MIDKIIHQQTVSCCLPLNKLRFGTVPSCSDPGLGLPSAGGSEVCTLHPLDVIKTRLMAQTSGRPSGNPDRNLRCGGNSTDNMELWEFHRKGSHIISKKMGVAKRA